MGSVYLYNKYATPIAYDLWTELRRLVNWACENWQRTDEGIWESRCVASTLFIPRSCPGWQWIGGCVARIKRSFPADRDWWLKTRDQIYEEAANLIMPLVFFVSPTDPRVLKTLQQIYRSPGKGGLVCNSLVHRYNVELTPDGLKGEEGTFNMCTFWLVEALTRTAHVRRNARIRQSPGIVCRRNRSKRRGAWELSAGVYAPGLNQRRIQSEPSARRRLA